ncbi:SIMPL domain-containing protein [Ferrimonas aestuarii]|nr:SIMPL domain-containing protein [Ferrimonas aestuarii]
MNWKTLYLTAVVPLAVVCSWTANAGERWIEVVGQSQVTLKADLVRISAQVDEIAKQPADSKRAVDAKMDRVLAALNDKNVDGSTIDAGSLRVMPEYNYESRNRELVGYRASRELSVMVAADQAGEWMARLLELGINQLDAPVYVASDSQFQREQLLTLAFDDAMEKAERLAKAAGDGLGKVLQVEPMSYSSPRPMMAMEKMADSGNYQPKGQQLQQQLRLRIALKDD